uniref:Secreted protein n=1 Tax=Knipowitschia caucasica TaxID=637954 RepID=A0AAV2KSL3_KNICA
MWHVWVSHPEPLLQLLRFSPSLCLCVLSAQLRAAPEPGIPTKTLVCGTVASFPPFYTFDPLSSSHWTGCSKLKRFHKCLPQD